MRSGGQGLPALVEREFGEFLSCGVSARGFARTGGSYIIAGVHQTQPVSRLLGFLATDLDPQDEIPFTHRLIEALQPAEFSAANRGMA